MFQGQLQGTGCGVLPPARLRQRLTGLIHNAATMSTTRYGARSFAVAFCMAAISTSRR